MSALPGSTDVFVIGGGPAGLAAAIAARRAGMDVTLADGSHPPIDKACGEGIMPDGVAAATALGIRLEDAGAYPFRGIRFSDGASAAAAEFPRGQGLGVRRTALHRLMVDCASAAGVRLAWNTRITGIAPEGVLADGRLVTARWIVGADGGRSMVRRWAGLEDFHRSSHRFGFRRHYRVAEWSDFMELHWAEGCQLYITPVGPREICVVSISRDSSLRLDRALPRFPKVVQRLASAQALGAELGGVSASRRLKRVYRDRVALAGDAAGAVDAITGDGLCILFQEAMALSRAMVKGDLAMYGAEHRRLTRRPELMSDLLLTLDRRNGLRGRVLRAMNANPPLFARMLAMHVGELSGWNFAATGLQLGWRMLTL